MSLRGDLANPMVLRISPFVFGALLLLFGQACGGGEDETDGRLRVVSSVAPITSLVENVGGNRIALEGVIPEGVNSHTFDPPPSVARTLAKADLIILNGLFLEEPYLEAAQASKRDEAEVLTLGDKAIARDQWVFDFSFPETGGHPNPHLWTSPLLALSYAKVVEEQLSAMDPANAAYYGENYGKLEARILGPGRQDRSGRADYPAAESEAPDLSRFLPLLRPSLRHGDNRRHSALRLQPAFRPVRWPVSLIRCGRVVCPPSLAPRCFPATSWSR